MDADKECVNRKREPGVEAGSVGGSDATAQTAGKTAGRADGATRRRRVDCVWSFFLVFRFLSCFSFFFSFSLLEKKWKNFSPV